VATKNLKIAFTGGGSGGHVSAAIAVLNELRKNHPKVYEKVVFIGGKRGMIKDPTPSLESRKIPELEIKFIPIRSGKLHRQFNLYTFKLLFGIFGGLIDAWKVLRREKPHVIFSTGGYVTTPVVIAASLLRIPSIIHEQTIVSGLANRISARFAKKILVSFEESKKFFPSKKTVHTGNPIRESRFKSDLNAVRRALGPQALPAKDKYFEAIERFASDSSRPFIFITGGGLGSHRINTWVLENLEKLIDKYNVLLQTGDNQYMKDFKKLKKAIDQLPPDQQVHIQVTKWFGDEIGYILKHANLVIGRPGANTVQELLATNKKAILIPIPWSSSNEQQLNAEFFIKNQTGKIVKQEKINEELLVSIDDIITQEAKDSSDIIKHDAAKKIVEILLSL
jgi:UDP-N-acetylglucosamine--N-acetylmuramyl-(pentapeptide) pyrophosphoryl-undecaprenol N-acetylglucosamine transferase